MVKIFSHHVLGVLSGYCKCLDASISLLLGEFYYVISLIRPSYAFSLYTSANAYNTCLLNSCSFVLFVFGLTDISKDLSSSSSIHLFVLASLLFKFSAVFSI